MRVDIPNKIIFRALELAGFENYTAGEGRLMLAELILKAAAGSCNSHTEEKFLNSFSLLKTNRTPNKAGFRFLVDMYYRHSNLRPQAFDLMEQHRRARD